MFALRDRRSRKFLKFYSGSFYAAESASGYRLRKLGVDQTRDNIHAELFSLSSADGAKLFKTRAGVAAAFDSRCWRRVGEQQFAYVKLPLEDAVPWLEIVDVEVLERRRAAAKRGAATRKQKSHR